MHTYTPIALGIALALGSGAALAGTEPTVTTKTTSPAIPAMPLKQALTDFAQREHLQFVYVSQVADGVRTQGAPAGSSQRATLQALLRGTGLQFRYLNPSTVTIVPAANPEVADPPSPQGTPPAKPVPPKQPATLQAIVVTGSHIRRADVETDNPIVTVSAEQIQATGKLTLGDVIQQLPAITGGVQMPNVNLGGGSGSTLVGLRGLGASRTLILIDGQRVVNSDLNAIPTAAVERIEVLTSGASAIYGSDAIGGVINFILKSNYQGAQFTANYGTSDRNDGTRRGASFIFGQTSDKGSILAGVDYNKFDEVAQGARKFSQNALSLSTTTSGRFLPPASIGGSSFAARDFISVGGALATQFGCPTPSNKAGNLSLNVSAWTPSNSPTSSGDYHCFKTSDKYNYAAVQLLVTPQERTNAFLRGTFHLTNNVDFYATVLHNNTSSGFQLAPALFGTRSVAGVAISKDSFYNPFKVDFSSAGGALYSVRLYPAGNRAADNSNVTDELQTGFRGTLSMLGRDWIWNVGYDYGHRSTVQAFLGLPNQPGLLPGLGPSFLNADGVVQCGTPANPIALSVCTPWDPFNLNSPSAQSVLSHNATPALTNTWRMERVYHVDANGELFDLPGGALQLAVGASYRSEYQNNTIDPGLIINPATGVCGLGSQCTAHLQGGFNVKEAYAEIFVPLLQGLPFAYGLNVTLGDRYSKYSTFGSTSNWKVGVEYRPIQDLLLRGTVAKVFRAPTIENLFSAPINSNEGLTRDPCNHITVANPACVGVPLTGGFVLNPTNQIVSLVSGSQFANFPLGPETGKSFDFGVVYSPHFVPGLSLSADFWRIYLNNTITAVGSQTVVDQCFNGVTIYCPLISRVQGGVNAGQLVQLILPTANLGRTDVKGVDFSGQYRLPEFVLGQFTVGLNATYLTQFKIQSAPGEAGNQVFNAAGVMGGNGSPLQGVCPFAIEQLCFFPRVRARSTLGWQLGPWDAQWTMTYSKAFRMDNQTGLNLPGIDYYGSYVYSDVTAGYVIKPLNTRLDIGVDNVFDKQPPMMFANRAIANTDPADFDIMGRYYWARVTVSF